MKSVDEAMLIWCQRRDSTIFKIASQDWYGGARGYSELTPATPASGDIVCDTPNGKVLIEIGNEDDRDWHRGHFATFGEFITELVEIGRNP